MRITKTVPLLFALLILGAGTAQAHIYGEVNGDGRPGSDGLEWYFAGSVFHTESVTQPTGRKKKRGQPVNFIFFGGHPYGQQDCSVQPGYYSMNQLCVFNHMSRAYPKMHKDNICDKQKFVPGGHHSAYMAFRRLGDGDNDQQSFRPSDFELYTARTDLPHKLCSRGYHARFYDDATHEEQLGDSHTPNDQFMVGNVHHEHRRGSGLVAPHQVDQDPDISRVHFFKQMASPNQEGSNYCGTRRWKVHPGAMGRYSKGDSSGIISRISMTPRYQGCKGE